MLSGKADVTSSYENGGQGRNRTADTWIFSPLLYRLSYLTNFMEQRKEMETRGLPSPTVDVKRKDQRLRLVHFL